MGRKKSVKVQRIRQIENHLRNYNTYKVGIKNLQRQLDYIMPNITANYELVNSSGVFTIKSDTEKYAIDRIESRRALNIHEDIQRYQIIIDSIDEAMKELSDLERKFIENRYFLRKTIGQTAIELGYSEKYIFNLRNQLFDKLLISLSSLII